jgi:hypothetical protein
MCSEANWRLIACVDISDISNKDISLLKGRGGQGGLTKRQEVLR